MALKLSKKYLRLVKVEYFSRPGKRMHAGQETDHVLGNFGLKAKIDISLAILTCFYYP